jgi:hypothetical protein
VTDVRRINFDRGWKPLPQFDNEYVGAASSCEKSYNLVALVLLCNYSVFVSSGTEVFYNFDFPNFITRNSYLETRNTAI